MPTTGAIIDELDIGQRVKNMRRQRGMTQQQLAAALAKSLPWVKAFEAGGVQSDPKISLLKQLATTLSVPLSELVDDKPAAEHAFVETVRSALLAPSPTSDPAGVDVTQQTTYGYAAFHAGRWQDVVRLLPRLIDTARAAEDSTGDPRILSQLADVCHLAAITLTKLGDTLGGWAAGDEALMRARAVGDPIGVALSAQSAVYAVTATGRADIGLGIAERTIDEYGPELSVLAEGGLSALGMVHLKAAYAAAALSQAELATDIIEEARRLAAGVAPDADYRLTDFNLTNVLVYEASILGDLGRYEAAIDAATRIHPAAFAALSRERRTHHLVDTARSAQRAGDPDAALRLLLQAERDDAQNIRSWAPSRAVIAALLAGRRPADDRRLRALAARAGVGG
ncbi:helix-turn-helix domain-containing protein [Catenulispora sp. NL8]|uniref:Helix-turn-helix domain-containing protein n=1 Tax=Catenulispora pinistramenti TaxID=2705254 RepID=A0ABS5KXS2_9ACTN|nr:helix-turn-helix domain-containing protein [Catenulispora pinistramenti]MBS2550817.1 helix-turn-helix domain-containing protein [Catenulispora pinistramenti]